MNVTKKWGKRILAMVSFFAISFGVMTIKSGGFALFGGIEGMQFAGNYISFVLWFNFVAGFFYIFSGVGLFLRKEWSKVIVKYLALLNPLVFIVFGLYVATGVDFEIRTVGAMLIRSLFWIGIFLYVKNKQLNDINGNSK